MGDEIQISLTFDQLELEITFHTFLLNNVHFNMQFRILVEIQHQRQNEW